jgi:hypothetical protein
MTDEKTIQIDPYISINSLVAIISSPGLEQNEKDLKLINLFLSCCSSRKNNGDNFSIKSKKRTSKSTASISGTGCIAMLFLPITAGGFTGTYSQLSRSIGLPVPSTPFEIHEDILHRSASYL